MYSACSGTPFLLPSLSTILRYYYWPLLLRRLLLLYFLYLAPSPCTLLHGQTGLVEYQLFSVHCAEGQDTPSIHLSRHLSQIRFLSSREQVWKKSSQFPVRSRHIAALLCKWYHQDDIIITKVQINDVTVIIIWQDNFSFFNSFYVLRLGNGVAFIQQFSLRFSSTITDKNP